MTKLQIELRENYTFVLLGAIGVWGHEAFCAHSLLEFQNVGLVKLKLLQATQQKNKIETGAYVSECLEWSL